MGETLHWTAVLSARIVGPFRSIKEVRDYFAFAPIPSAVVLGTQLVDGSGWELVDALRACGVPHLLLIGSHSSDESDRHPGIAVLRKPFAAYQVMEWAAQFTPVGEAG
jgi:DNA-binding response OmpR family regulator